MPRKGQVSHGKQTLALEEKCPCSLCEKGRQKRLATKRASYHRCIKPDRSAYSKEYYEKHKDYYKEYYEVNKERYLKHFKTKYHADKDYAREKINKRRKLKEIQIGIWPMPEAAWLDLLFAWQQEACYYCDRSLEKGYHAEHKTPLSRGGLHDYRNVVLSCATCNLRKGNKTEEEYREFLDTKTPA